ncbi:MAG: polysaccharide biosynthesis C-terminal domain-containing protein [Bacteroidales bacterium]|nr:polysaccharide biosynthesis C-terminal domain-containing protein [Bacteroidales bacterium]
MNPFKKLLGQTAIYGLPSILGRFLNYCLVFLHTNIFVTSNYGVQNYFYAIAAFMAVVLTYGMETAYFRYTSLADDKDRVFSTAQYSLYFTTIPILALLLIFAPNIAAFLGYPNNADYVVWFALMLSFDALCAIPFARLRVQNKALKFASLKFFNIVVNIAFNLIFLLWFPTWYANAGGQGIIALLYNPQWNVEYVFLANLIASTLTFIMLLPSAINLKAGFDKELWKQMFIYAFPLLFFGMAGIVNETFDRILLRYLLPSDIAEAQIGIYGACYKISILMTIFIQAYKYAAEPFFFSYSKEKDAKQTYADLMTYFVIATSFIFLATTLFMDVALLMIGKDFREGKEIIPILLMANLFLGVFYNLSIWYKLSNQTKYGAYIAIAGAVVTIAANLILIPRMGYQGSAWATFICYAMMMLVSFVLGHKYYPIPYNYKRLLFYPALAVMFCLPTALLPLPSLALKYALAAIIVVIYCVVAYSCDLKKVIRR